MRHRVAAGLFVGRAAEVATLTAGIERSPYAALIEGEAGVGKTALVAKVLRRARSARVVRTAASPVDPDALVAALTGLDLSVDPPSVIVVEDVHWSSAEAVEALLALVDELDVVPVAVLVTTRPPPHDRHVGHLFERLARRGAARLELEGLSAAELRELAAQAIGRDPSEALDRSLAATGGNALLATEILNDSIDGQPSPTSSTLRSIVQHRIDAIGGDARAWAGAAAVLGSFTPATLASLVRRSELDLIPSLRAAMSAGLLASTDTALSFRHELIREIVYEDVPPAVRGSLHRAAALVLDDHGASPRAIIFHAELATVTGSDSAWFIDLAVRLSTMAPASSLPLLERALELAGHDGRGDEVRAAMIKPLATRGALAEAEALARSVIATVPPGGLRDKATSSLLYALQRKPAELDQLVDSILSDERENPALAVGALLQASVVSLTSGRLPAARTAANRALAMGDAAINGRQFFESIAALADAGDGYTAAALDRCPGPDEGPSEPFVRLVRACLLVDLDRLDGAIDQFATAASLEADRDLLNRALSLAGLAFAHLLAGDLQSAAIEAQRAGDAAPASAREATTDALIRTVNSRVNLLTNGHTGGGIDPLDEPALLGELPSWARAIDLEGRGAVDEAFGELHDAWEAAAGARWLMTWRSVAPDLVRLAVRVGAADVAAAVAAVADDGARRCPVESAAGAAMRCAGLLHGDGAVLEAAARRLAAAGRPIDAAAALGEAADALEPEDRRRSRQLRQAAADRYLTLGATAAAAVQIDRLGPGRRPARRPAAGWDALTPAELRVVELVTRGLTNPQIAAELGVSRHTVGSHIRHVFMKLNVSSRAALATAAARANT